MWKLSAGVVLALLVAVGVLFYQNKGMTEELQEKRSTIEDLQYDLRSWEQAGLFWQQRDQAQQQLVIRREQRNHQLNAENDDLKKQLRGISDEIDPCLNHVVSDDALGILWDDTAKAAAQLRNPNGNIHPADTGAATTSTR